MRGSLALLLFLALTHEFFQACKGQQAIDDYLARMVNPSPRLFNFRWIAVHQGYMTEVESYRADGMDLLLYGDSIVEGFRGLGLGSSRPKMRTNKEAWTELIQPNFRAVPWGISGDRAMNLLWRIRNGEGPEGMRTKVIVVLIGTNDIGRMQYLFEGAPDIVVRATFVAIRSVLEELVRQAPEAKVVVFSLPPLQPNGYKGYQWIIDGVNKQLQQYAEKAPVQFLDCGERFYSDTELRIANATLMPDGMHPLGEGAWVLTQCVLDAVAPALGTHSVRGRVPERASGGESGGEGGAGGEPGGEEGAGGGGKNDTSTGTGKGDGKKDDSSKNGDKGSKKDDAGKKDDSSGSGDKGSKKDDSSGSGDKGSKKDDAGKKDDSSGSGDKGSKKDDAGKKDDSSGSGDKGSKKDDAGKKDDSSGSGDKGSKKDDAGKKDDSSGSGDKGSKKDSAGKVGSSK